MRFQSQCRLPVTNLPLAERTGDVATINNSQNRISADADYRAYQRSIHGMSCVRN